MRKAIRRPSQICITRGRFMYGRLLASSATQGKQRHSKQHKLLKWYGAEEFSQARSARRCVRTAIYKLPPWKEGWGRWGGVSCTGDDDEGKVFNTCDPPFILTAGGPGRFQVGGSDFITLPWMTVRSNVRVFFIGLLASPRIHGLLRHKQGEALKRVRDTPPLLHLSLTCHAEVLPPRRGCRNCDTDRVGGTGAASRPVPPRRPSGAFRDDVFVGSWYRWLFTLPRRSVGQ